MVYHSFRQLLERVRENPVRRRVAAAGAADRHVLEALLEAQKAGIADPVLIGDASEIAKHLEALGCRRQDYSIVDAADPVQCGERAVELIREQNADFIMKGMIETRDVLKPLVKKENGLSLGRTMTHVALNEIPGMNRLTALTDGGMIPYPTLEESGISF
jgi:phosphate butyryltransferase